MSNGERRAAREPSLGELVAIASRDVSLLVRQEIELAKAEMGREVAQAAVGAGLLGAAAGLLLGTLIALTIFLGELFSWLGLARFWSFLIAAGVFLVLAGLLALVGVGRLRTVRPPRRAISSVREDVEMLKQRRAAASRIGAPAVPVPAARPDGHALDAAPHEGQRP